MIHICLFCADANGVLDLEWVLFTDACGVLAAHASLILHATATLHAQQLVSNWGVFISYLWAENAYLPTSSAEASCSRGQTLRDFG
jgi:hypothetical protein